MPRLRASASASSSSRVLPMPASPSISTTASRPDATRSRASPRTAISRRPPADAGDRRHRPHEPDATAAGARSGCSASSLYRQAKHWPTGLAIPADDPLQNAITPMTTTAIAGTTSSSWMRPNRNVVCRRSPTCYGSAANPSAPGPRRGEHTLQCRVAAVRPFVGGDEPVRSGNRSRRPRQRRPRRQRRPSLPSRGADRPRGRRNRQVTYATSASELNVHPAASVLNTCGERTQWLTTPDALPRRTTLGRPATHHAAANRSLPATRSC